MRTFHIGGAASRATAVNNVQVKSNGTAQIAQFKVGADMLRVILWYVSRSGELAVVDEHGRERERYKFPYGADLDRWLMANKCRAGQIVATWDPHTHPVITEVAGTIKFVDLIDGVTMHRQTDEVTGLDQYCRYGSQTTRYWR